MNRKIFVSTLLLWVFAVTAAWSQEDQTGTVHEGLSYSGKDKWLKLDLYLPSATTQPVPCIVVIQGGGFMARNGKGFRNFARHFAANGFAAATIAYRGRPENTWQTTVADTKTAVRYLRKVSGNYGIDPKRIGAMGRSAGGTLAVMLAVSGDDTPQAADTEHSEFSSEIQAAVGICGIYDFVARFSDPTQKALQPGLAKKLVSNGEWIGTPFLPTDKEWTSASAINALTPNDPPILFLQSRNDPVVPWLQAQNMHDAMLKAKLRPEIKITETGGHGGPPNAEDLMVEYFRKVL